jgi:hypothetical protein
MSDEPVREGVARASATEAANRIRPVPTPTFVTLAALQFVNADSLGYRPSFVTVAPRRGPSVTFFG